MDISIDLSNILDSLYLRKSIANYTTLLTLASRSTFPYLNIFHLSIFLSMYTLGMVGSVPSSTYNSYFSYTALI